MSIVNKKLWEKYPEARVDLDPDVEFEVDFAVICDILRDKGRVWDGEGEIKGVVLDASDDHKADAVKIEGRGWFALTKEQARTLDERFFEDEE